jgi:hypothetical protein
MNSILFSSEFCNVEYLENHNAIFCQWKKFCTLDNYRKPFEIGLELIREKSVTTWVTDTTNGFENELEDTEWLLGNFLPKIVETSCNQIVFVIQKESPLKHEIDEQTKVLSQYFNVQQIEKIEDLNISEI